MSTLQKIISLILVICFIGLVYLFFKTYQDTQDANRYIEFVTSSANDVISEVDGVNDLLNNIQYTEDQSYLAELEGGLTSLQSKLDTIERDHRSYEVPYNGGNVESSFTEFMGKGNDIEVTLSELVAVVKNLEGKDKFEAKVDEYISSSNELQNSSTKLEGVLNEYVQNYNKVDFKRIIDAATNL